MRKLETVTDLLDALREEKDWPSDYRISKELEINQTTISAWRTGRSVPREMHVLVIAKALNISPPLVMAICIATKARDKKVRAAWGEVVKQLARAGLPALAAFLIASAAYSPPAKSERAVDAYYGKSRRRRPQRPTRMLQAA